MNSNEKEKLARIEIRVKQKEKEAIQQIAKSCGLPVSEYMVKRALGYAPRAVQPDIFFDFYGKLCELLSRDLSPETEAAALRLFDDIYAEMLDAPKQTAQQIRREAAAWQAQDSGPSSPA